MDEESGWILLSIACDHGKKCPTKGGAIRE